MAFSYLIWPLAFTIQIKNIYYKSCSSNHVLEVCWVLKQEKR